MDVSMEGNMWYVFYKDQMEIRKDSLQRAVDEMYSLLWIQGFVKT